LTNAFSLPIYLIELVKFARLFPPHSLSNHTAAALRQRLSWMFQQICRICPQEVSLLSQSAFDAHLDRPYGGSFFFPFLFFPPFKTFIGSDGHGSARMQVRGVDVRFHNLLLRVWEREENLYDATSFFSLLLVGLFFYLSSFFSYSL